MSHYENPQCPKPIRSNDPFFRWHRLDVSWKLLVGPVRDPCLLSRQATCIARYACKKTRGWMLETNFQSFWLGTIRGWPRASSCAARKTKANEHKQLMLSLTFQIFVLYILEVNFQQEIHQNQVKHVQSISALWSHRICLKKKRRWIDLPCDRDDCGNQKTVAGMGKCHPTMQAHGTSQKKFVDFGKKLPILRSFMGPLTLAHWLMSTQKKTTHTTLYKKLYLEDGTAICVEAGWTRPELISRT